VLPGGSGYRSFTLDSDVDEAQAQAKYDNGVLELTLPKKNGTAAPDFQIRMYGVADCGSLLGYFQNRALFRILGTGYYHPVLPFIAEADR
jgi:Hsp20/alpha crystallin family